MNVIPLRAPTKNELLDYIDVLLEQIKAYNSHCPDLKVSKVVLAGKILTLSRLDNTIYLQFKDKNGEVFPPVWKNIKKDYFDEKKIDSQLARISKRPKI